MKACELKAYRFVGTGGKGFRVVVLAKNRLTARAHVKWQATSSLAWRSLKFVGDDHPSEQDRKYWLVSVVRPDKPDSVIR